MKHVLTSLYKVVFVNNSYNPQKELLAALFFAVFIFIGLGIDSVYFLNSYFDGRWLMNGFAIVHFCYFFNAANTELRKLMFVMVPLSYLGEIIFCHIFGMYHYRTNEIPLYVPFGHAILYATGLVCSQTKWAVKNEVVLRNFFIVFYLTLFLIVGLFFNDLLSLIFGLFFFLVIQKRNWRSLFFFVSAWVVVLELVGTFYQCWGWYSVAFGVIPTINPPMGAAFIYVGGDISLNKLVRFIDHKFLLGKVYSAKI